MSDKKYGLLLPGKGSQKLKFQASRNVFGNDSDSDGEASKKPVLLKPNNSINRQAKISQEKAIIEDPTVYQYDEIYDQMADEKQKEKKKIKEDKKPKYIENLMKTATKRKMENERRIERQIQKEREKEGDEFKDKEVFVTSAYKKKLEEMRKEEEREKREEYLENIGDVTKQQDLGGFYRHLYEQKLGSDRPKTEGQNKDAHETNKTETQNSVNESQKANKEKKAKSRNYRKRKLSESQKDLSDGEIDESDEEINRLNLKDIEMAKKNKPSDENIDADSDFSIDESSDDEHKPKIKSPTTKEIIKSGEITLDVKQSNTNQEQNKENIGVDLNNSISSLHTKPKIDIWKKRTVGELFDQALKRYYERKAARGY